MYRIFRRSIEYWRWVLSIPIFFAFVIMTTNISVVYSWLYNAIGKKLITVLILHAMSNTAAPLLPFLLMEEGKPENAYWIYAGVNVLAALIACYFIMRNQKTSDDKE